MDSSVSPKDEIWFLRVCHHVSTGPYLHWTTAVTYFSATFIVYSFCLHRAAAGRSGARTPAIGTYPYASRAAPTFTQPPVQWVPCLFPGGRAVTAWFSLPTPRSTEVKVSARVPSHFNWPLHYCLALCFVYSWCTVSGGVMAKNKSNCLTQYKYLFLSTILCV